MLFDESLAVGFTNFQFFISYFNKLPLAKSLHKYIFSWNIFLQVEFLDESIAIFMIFDKLFSLQKS